MQIASHARRWAPALLLLFSLAGCAEDRVVFREPVNPPPDLNSGFLGYFRTSDKQSTCGNCHVGHQTAWERTAHADAYATLASNPGAQSFCYSCHTVSDKGNIAAGPAGWDAVADTAYHDVQCESCHGPGFDHAQEPDAPPGPNNPPLAHIAVLGHGTTSDSIAKAQSCADCHSGYHHPFVEEWEQSAHARSLEEDPGEFVADNPSCASCHEGKAALQAWGVTANYVEKSQTGSANYLGMTCAVCHDPHGSRRDASGNPVEGQLRFPIDVPDANQNLCMKCHQRRSTPDQASSRGPHSPQGPMLLADAGYRPANFAPEDVAETSHGLLANPRLCAGCHVNRYTVTDEANALTFQSVGHLFLPIPCLDGDGKPSTDKSCAYTTEARTWGSCTQSGCHANATQAANLLGSSRNLMDQLTKQIWDDKDGDDAIDPAPTDGGMLSNTTAIPTSGTGNQYVTNDGVITPAEGARFNVRMLRPGGADGSFGVHNPFYARDLLLATIDELESTYPLAAVSPSIQKMVDDRNRRVMQLHRSAPSKVQPVSTR